MGKQYYINEKALSKLEALSNIPEKSQWHAKIYSTLAVFFSHLTLMFNDRLLSSYRTQEHLIKGFGSWTNIHFKIFRQEIEAFASKNFQILKKELQEGILGADTIFFKIILGHKRWTNQIKKRLCQLERGQSLWIEASTYAGYHAMLMRIEKVAENTFDLFFANSGAGIDDNYDFHPVKIKNGRKEYQLVAQIKGIPSQELLNTDFFLNFSKTAEKGKPSLNALFLESSEAVKKHSVINNLYAELRGLLKGQAKLLESNDARFWYRRQLTNSCGASCIWAMIKTRLSEEEAKALEFNMQINDMVKHYRQIKVGSDLSNTRKIMVLDLIQSIYQKTRDKALLEKIRQELLTSLQMQDGEVKISSKTSLERMLTPRHGSLETFYLKPFEVNFSNKLPSLISTYTQTSLVVAVHFNSLHVEDIPFKINKRNGQYVGQAYLDEVALLTFNVATGNHEQSAQSLHRLLKLTPDLKNLDFIKKQYAIIALYSLIKQLRRHDATRSGVAKQQFLINLAFLILLNNKIKLLAEIINILKLTSIEERRNDLQSFFHRNNYIFDEKQFKYLLFQFELINEKCEHLEIDKLLSPDNLWQKSLKAALKNFNESLKELLFQPPYQEIKELLF